jgi:hypothetical protein
MAYRPLEHRNDIGPITTAATVARSHSCFCPRRHLLTALSNVAIYDCGWVQPSPTLGSPLPRIDRGAGHRRPPEYPPRAPINGFQLGWWRRNGAVIPDADCKECAVDGIGVNRTIEKIRSRYRCRPDLREVEERSQQGIIVRVEEVVPRLVRSEPWKACRRRRYQGLAGQHARGSRPTAGSPAA